MSYIIVGVACVICYVYRDKLWDMVVAMWKDDMPEDRSDEG